jgi:hypothetical protein
MWGIILLLLWGVCLLFNEVAASIARFLLQLRGFNARINVFIRSDTFSFEAKKGPSDFLLLFSI